jgi:hypothetical protein
MPSTADPEIRNSVKLNDLRNGPRAQVGRNLATLAGTSDLRGAQQHSEAQSGRGQSAKRTESDEPPEVLPADLQRVVDAWARLPDPLKAAIQALMRAANGDG